MVEQINIAGYIDHTLLNPEATAGDIVKLCKEAARYRFAAVCVSPYYVKTACKQLHGSTVKVSAVVGFPLGAATAAVKSFEAAGAVADGAAEIDMVMNIGAFKSGQKEYVLTELAAVVEASRGRPVKVIIETGLLTDVEKATACRLAKQAGARFVKTCTGFGPGGATVADVRLIREAVGPELGVKASGGVRTRQAALELIAAGATRIGTSSGVAIIEEE
ncbi:MAG TPA: deoxyribose-phosphate aldolase [Firmicutes bacterium]|nr:deoxyribose-phosphate aldolase [Bacillota bacterium]